MKYLYGFKIKGTDIFKAKYRTIRYKEKTACFRTETNAINSLKYQQYKDDVEVSKMVVVEDY